MTVAGNQLSAKRLASSPSDPASIRPPVTRRGVTMGVLGVAALALTAASAGFIEFDPSTLGDGFGSVLNLVERMLPARVDNPGRISSLAVQTLMIALLGTVFAVVVSVPLAFLAAQNTTPNRVVYGVARAVITVCRAVPDLVFAVLLVRALGLGLLPGVLALAMHSVGMVAKLFAEAIERTDRGPREAVRSTGVGPIRELITGVLPQVVPSWISTFIYRIDINLRTSVVLGFVGAGGIGFALQDSLRGLVYDKALGIVLIILVMITAMELISIVTRRLLLTPSAERAVAAPRNLRSVWPPLTRDRLSQLGFGALLVGATIYALVSLKINVITIVTGIPAMIEVTGRLFPPDFLKVGDELLRAVVETVAIGLVATAVGVVLSIPVGLLAASNVAPSRGVYWAARGFLLMVRAVPELILAVVFVAALGLGPVAGACALAIGSIGFLGKLVADAAEEVDAGTAEAVRAVGGSRWQVLFSAILPQSMPSLLGSSLYLLDVNIRTSTILGIVGAGGVGFLLLEAIRTLNFEFAGAIILIIFLIVYLIERLSGWIRSQLF